MTPAGSPAAPSPTDELILWDGDRLTHRQSWGRLGVRITGSGRYLPGPEITNAELLARTGMDTTADWLLEHTGIRARHHAPQGQATSDLAAAAAGLALADAGIEAADLDRILLCTTTGDWTSPAAANRVQLLLGARCPAVDVQSACASWLYGLDMGARMVATGLRNVLVVGADVKSRFLRRGDRRLGPVLADGAGAVVLDAHDGPGGFSQIELYADGSKFAHLITPAGGSAMPASAATLAADMHTTQLGIPGGVLKQHAVFAMSRLTRQMCAQEGIGLDEVDWVVPHQANGAILRALVEDLGVPVGKVVDTIADTGNIVAATLPYAYDLAAREGRFAPGDRIVFVTAGAGYSAGAALYTVPD